MSESKDDLLERHTADWDEESRVVACSCGDTAGYVVHIAALLGTDEAGARDALLAVHDNVEISAGMCGGCDTCGSESASVACPICGEGFEPCLTYYEASGQGPSAESTIEGPK